MDQHAWFGVGVRLFGIYCIFSAAQHLFYFLDIKLGFSPMYSLAGRADPTENPFGYFVYVIGYLLFGVGLIVLADGIVERAYRPMMPNEYQDPESESA